MTAMVHDVKPIDCTVCGSTYPSDTVCPNCHEQHGGGGLDRGGLNREDPYVPLWHYRRSDR